MNRRGIFRALAGLAVGGAAAVASSKVAVGQLPLKELEILDGGNSAAAIAHSHTLATASLPSHTHSISYRYDGIAYRHDGNGRVLEAWRHPNGL